MFRAIRVPADSSKVGAVGREPREYRHPIFATRRSAALKFRQQTKDDHPFCAGRYSVATTGRCHSVQPGRDRCLKPLLRQESFQGASLRNGSKPRNHKTEMVLAGIRLPPRGSPRPRLHEALRHRAAGIQKGLRRPLRARPPRLLPGGHADMVPREIRRRGARTRPLFPGLFR